MIRNDRKITFKISTILMIFLGTFFVNCSKSYATRELQETTLDVANRSDNIVVAKCISTESRWNEQGSLIFTYVTFQIQDTVKGNSTDENLTLRFLGGRVGDTVQTVPDMPQFSENEEVMLFLAPRNKSGYQTLTSIQNGVLRIKTDSETGKKLITSPTTGIQLYERNTGEPMSTPHNNGVLLEDFNYSVKKAID
ncbi:MAG: hypothetical protein WBD99_15375 [Thermodesulfobacteriota bacterium]